MSNIVWREARWTAGFRNWIGNATALMVRFKSLAPYALIELVMPGGTVMALLLWLYRRRKDGIGLPGIPGRLLSLLRLADPLRARVAVCAALGVGSILTAIVSTARHLGNG